MEIIVDNCRLYASVHTVVESLYRDWAEHRWDLCDDSLGYLDFPCSLRSSVPDKCNLDSTRDACDSEDSSSLTELNSAEDSEEDAVVLERQLPVMLKVDR